MNRLTAAWTALDRWADAQAAGRPQHELDQLEAAYRDARHKATDQLAAYRCKVERLPTTSTWLVGQATTILEDQP